jgi:hypothetical protein
MLPIDSKLVIPSVTKDLEERKKLTFEQAEGVEPLPSQLQLREVSQELRAIMWDTVRRQLDSAITHPDYDTSYVGVPWSTILEHEHVRRGHRTDDFDSSAESVIMRTRGIFEKGDYLAIFGWLEFVLKHRNCPHNFPHQVENVLRHCRAAYRVIDRQVICPISSEAEHATIVKAFADLSSTQFNGARAHLRKAASHLTAGAYADSVRESIHAVEAVGRSLDPNANMLSKALGRLEQKVDIHPAMRKGFASLYDYTSDEKGIRHALLDDSTARVDETDAMFMLSACAAFVSYLINKARANGLLK